jgi:hypothetical protein
MWGILPLMRMTWRNEWENGWQAANDYLSTTNEKRPEEGHLVGLAGSCRADGEQRELVCRLG